MKNEKNKFKSHGLHPHYLLYQNAQQSKNNKITQNLEIHPCSKQSPLRPGRFWAGNFFPCRRLLTVHCCWLLLSIISPLPHKMQLFFHFSEQGLGSGFCWFLVAGAWVTEVGNCPAFGGSNWSRQSREVTVPASPEKLNRGKHTKQTHLNTHVLRNLHPVLAALALAFSSVSVVSNSLRLKRLVWYYIRPSRFMAKPPLQRKTGKVLKFKSDGIACSKITSLTASSWSAGSFPPEVHKNKYRWPVCCHQNETHAFRLASRHLPVRWSFPR